LKLSSLATFACAALVLAGAAGATPTFGVAEDAAKYDDDGGAAVHAALNDLGMTDVRVWIFWDPARPAEIVERPFLDRSMPVAETHGVRVTFAVSPLRARAVSGSPFRQAQFAAFLQLLARTYPQVTRFIVGNEPNQPRFWQPQFRNGKSVSGAAYERLLAISYDALKAVNPEITVVGLGLSPRGNDRPRARSNRSTSPVRFIHDLGVAYRRSGRTRPIMDTLGFHPYPRFDRDPLARGYAWPNAGMTNLDRIKQAVWDAFHGTAQPTFAEADELLRQAGSRPPLTLTLDEVGWQVQIPREARHAYHGRENVRGTDETQQARIYSQIIDIVACDEAIESLHFFHLIDERDLDRFQSGLVRADWSRRPSYFSVKSRIDQVVTEDGAHCFGRPVQWRHATTVLGARADFASQSRSAADFGFRLRATEEAAYQAGLFPVSSVDLLEDPEGAAIQWLLDRGQTRLMGLPAAEGRLRAYAPLDVRVGLGRLVPGEYVYAVRLTAALNPGRSSFFMSEPFRVG
jgi:hypothetical protein